MKNKILAIAIVLISAVVSYGVASLRPATIETVVKEVPAGAVTGPVINSPYVTLGGVTQWNYRNAMDRATTTLCAFQSPAATSTLDYVGYIINTGTSTAATIDVAKGTTRWATTTLLVTGTSVASGATKEISWTSAGATAADDIMAPNTFVLVKTASAGLGGYTYGGICSVRFQEF